MSKQFHFTDKTGVRHELLGCLNTDQRRALLRHLLEAEARERVEQMSEFTFSAGKYEFINASFPKYDEARIWWTSDEGDPVAIALLSFAAALAEKRKRESNRGD